MSASIERFISARRGGTILESMRWGGPCPSGARSLAIHCFMMRIDWRISSHADAVAVVTIAVLADRGVEIKLRIALVRLGLAQVPGGAATAHHHARETPSPGVGERNYADVRVAFFEDAIVSEQTLDIVAHLQEWVAERFDIVDQFWRKVLMYAADSEIGRMHAATRGTLIENHQLLALLEPPQRWGERAHVHGLGGDIEQMRKQPSDFAIEDADELRAARDRDAQKLFRRQAERML